MNRSLLFGTTFLRNTADAPGGAAPVEPVVAPAAAAPEPAAAAPEPAAAPAAPEPAAAEPAVAPVEPAAAEAPKPDDAAADGHAKPTLLEEAGDKKPEDATGGKPAEGAAAKPDEAPAAAAAPGEPVKYEFKWPEGMKADEAAVKPYTDLLAEANVAPEVGQKMLDLHVGEMTKYASQLARDQHTAWEKTRETWRDQVTADEQIGGSGHKTAMTQIAAARDALVPEADRKSFNEFLRVTGAGDHPAFLRMLHNAAKVINEPSRVALGNPTKANGQRPGRRGLQSIYAENAAARSN